MYLDEKVQKISICCSIQGYVPYLLGHLVQPEFLYQLPWTLHKRLDLETDNFFYIFKILWKPNNKILTVYLLTQS